MGKAAEAAYANALLHGLSADQAAEDARSRFYGLSEGEDSEHAEYAAWIARGFVEQTAPEWGKLVQHGPWRPLRVGLEAEISLKPDFIFENALVDTKATLRIPSEPSANHVRQISAYAQEWKLPGVLFYAAPQISKGECIAYRHVHHAVSDEDAEKACRGLMMDWRQIEAWNNNFASVEDVMRVTPLNTESFYWDEDQKEEAEQLWERASGPIEQRNAA